MGDDSTGAFGGIRRRPWVLVLILLMAASAALLLTIRSRLGFMLDDWALVIYRDSGGIGDFLDPHNENIIVLPTLIYKASLSIFGMEAMPLQVTAVAMFLASVALLFIWVRTELGDFLAVVACAVILFFGVAWEDLLWAFQIGYFGSAAAGIGALLLIRRGDRQGDILACLLLTVSILFSSLGIPFVAGALVALLLDTRGSGLRGVASRIWVMAMPTVIFIGWWLGWGQNAENFMSLDNAIETPRYILSALGLTVGELTGLYRILDQPDSRVDPLLGLITIALLALVLWRRRNIPAPFLVAAAAAFVFWGLAGLNVMPGRDYLASRYQYPGGLLVLMMFAGAFSGMKPAPAFRWAITGVAVFAIAANVVSLRDGYREVFRPVYEKGIAGLTALDIARAGTGKVDPDFYIGMNQADTAVIDAGSWFDAEDRYGDLGWNREELLAEDDVAQARVDQVLAGALPIASEQLPASAWRRLPQPDTCQRLEAAPDGSPAVPVRTGSLVARSREDLILETGRFGPEAANPTAFVFAGKTNRITIPPDAFEHPWKFAFAGNGPVIICQTR